MTEFSFRLRFSLGRGVRINSDEVELLLTEGSGETVRLVGFHLDSGSMSKISESRTLSLWGRGYESREQATDAGTRWTGYLQAAFALLGIGVDFGRRTPPTSHFTEFGLKYLEQLTGGRVLNDVHGLMVFESDPQPARFAAMALENIAAQPSGDRLRSVVARARSDGYVPDHRVKLAFDLYGASFFEYSADARYMMLMMAVEALATQNTRSDPCREHVDQLIAATRASGLDKDGIASMVGSLEHLKHESVTGAGKRLARERLDDRVYGGKPAVEFFADAYALRSALAHGDEDRPPHDEIESQAVELRRFVGDLLSGPLLSFEA
jgi:hypothetical protein